MEEKNVIALGFFDGVHIGHGALLRKTVERAAELGAASAAFTFDRAPKEFVTGVPVPLLTGVEERSALIRELYGVERTIVAPFDRDMMQTSAVDFLEKLLVGKHHAAHLVAGHDYRFGYKNEGTPEMLREWCAAHDVGCDIIPKVELHGVTVSSTHVRELVENGDMPGAAEFLGHPFFITGTVKHGKHLGTEVLFPTVNLVPEPWRVLPRFGVYAVRVRLPDGSVYAGVTNVGIRPTIVDDNSVTIETFLVDFEGDLYEKELRLEFLRYLRPERKFDSMAQLHRQIEKDVNEARGHIA
ncbi:MAG: bifunctional riboflavin kinase/FAD synthetase [Oscillospiraceae bacterium]|nr:bifunctional riboflavin kinase/FAD synthetase [Oscillospiraceae bacterium]